MLHEPVEMDSLYSNVRVVISYTSPVKLSAFTKLKRSCNGALIILYALVPFLPQKNAPEPN
jgi:hypothetical protein